ncbi:MAG: hypothetical protein JW955_09895 [Sedimentisphaerales bacterium]|nr:hypothetical protein [Sedimentisphaerales bacterium]
MTPRGQNSECHECQGFAGSASEATETRFVDLHCHCLPNLDDGPDSAEGAVALCRALVEDHVCTVVATPHQLGQFENRATAKEIRLVAQSLNRELMERGVDLEVLPGAEIRLDERIDRLLAEEEVLTLADRKRHVLLELPSDVFIDIEPLVLGLQSQGIDLVIAHPERNIPLLEQPRLLRRWLGSGVTLQVTAASLTGEFGLRAERAAWRLISEGWAAMIATDAHDHYSDPPRMTAAFELVTASLGRDLAQLLCVENPSRIVRGERLVHSGARQREEAR